METKTKDSIFMMAVTAVMAALIAVVAPFSIPAGQVVHLMHPSPLPLPLHSGLEAGRLGHFDLYYAWDGGYASIQRL